MRFFPERRLPEQAFIPGRTSRPADPTERTLARPAAEWRYDPDYLFGLDLYAAGFLWEAHECWERIWRLADTDPAQRDFLQGLIQCAAAALKVAMDQPAGARTLAARAAEHLEGVAARGHRVFMGLDPAAVARAFTAWISGEPRTVDQRPRLEPRIRSRDLLGCLTDLLTQPEDSRTFDRDDYLLGRTDARPDYYSGQVMILDAAPAPSQIEERFELCRRELSEHPVRKLNLLWEREDEERWPAASAVFSPDHYYSPLVLRSERAPAPRPAPEGVALRALDGDADWAAATELALEIGATLFGEDSREFSRWRYAEFRRSLAGAGGQFWGAFRGRRLVASLGLFETPTLLRFQDVQTRAAERERGIASALVATSLAAAFTRNPEAIAVISAERHSAAERIYRRLGFRTAGAHHWLSRPACWPSRPA